MSAFIKKLEQISRTKGRSIGFGASVKANDASMMLVARLFQADAGAVSLAVEGKADALLFDLADPGANIDALSEITGSIPWGVRLRTGGADEVKRFSEEGCDYFVFDPSLPVLILDRDGVGKVLEVDTALGDGVARTIAQTPIDVLFITEDTQVESLAIAQLLNYQRICGFSGKIALVNLPQDLADLALLREAGVGGVVVECDKGSERKVVEVREAIAALPVSMKKGKGGTDPLLPNASAVTE
ncbi:MAG: hypothetical protein SVM79_06425 [Chloroflexota bacterium]|nr:hypothetical protein [Chloroflexota bacterium]